MGNMASFTGRYIMRKSRRFNVENRAQRFIDQEKLPVAPKHPSTSELIESISKDPKVRKELMRKHTALDENLKQVYVKSLHKPFSNDDEREKLQKSKLPQERGLVPDMKYGHTEPMVVPKGKYSLPQVIDMLSDHINDPMIHTPQVLAQRYSLDVKLVESIILYFKLFKVERTDGESNQKLMTRQKMSAFAELEEYMSKQTMIKIADNFGKIDKEYEELLRKQKAESEAKDSQVVVERNQGDEIVMPNEEDLRHEIENDSVYKKVGFKKKQKKETTK